MQNCNTLREFQLTTDKPHCIKIMTALKKSKCLVNVSTMIGMHKTHQHKTGKKLFDYLLHHYGTDYCNSQCKQYQNSTEAKRTKST